MAARPAISQRKMAQKMGVSSMFLSDLEAGKRRWSPERSAAFLAVLEAQGSYVPPPADASQTQS